MGMYNTRRMRINSQTIPNRKCQQDQTFLHQPQAQCDATVKTKEGWIYTPNYPSDYDNYRTCIYVIERASGNVCKVEMTIIDFDLQDTEGCYADYFEIQDGRQNQRLCGALATGIKKTLYFPAGLRTITMRFQSDGQLTFKGFMLHLKQIKNSCSSTAPVLPPPPGRTTAISEGTGGTYGYDCDKTIDGFKGRFTSPGFPRSYPPGKICRYLIIRATKDVCRFDLLFKTFKVDYSPGCTKDYVQLPDKSRICGQHIPIKTFEFPRGSQALQVTFISDGYEGDNEFRGFDILVAQVPNSCRSPPTYYPTFPTFPTVPTKPIYPPTYTPPGSCDIDNFMLESRIISPGYPYNYGPDQYCVFTIHRFSDNVCLVELRFREFDVEYSGAGCTKDYLELPNGVRLCGKVSRTRHLTFEPGAKQIQLKFVSDGYIQDKGFDISVSQILNSCSPYQSVLIVKNFSIWTMLRDRAINSARRRVFTEIVMMKSSIASFYGG